MFDTLLHPFEAVRNAAETLTDLRVQSQLLSELAQQQLLTRQFDAALHTFAAIPVPQERRIALLVADFRSLPSDNVEALVQLLQTEPQTQLLAGRLALTMLEAKNTRSAWKLVETTAEAFESEQQQYDFLEKVLSQLPPSDWEKVPHFYQSFKPGIYQDWALLAINKYLTQEKRFADAQRYAELLALPSRKSWAYWQMSLLTSAEESTAKESRTFFDKAVTILASIEINPTDEEAMEALATQLRIFGRATVQQNSEKHGERLLERSEAAAASLPLPMQRYRQQCFLGKVLLELGHIASIKDYLPIDNMLASLSSDSDRSRVSVWLAEAGWHEGWTKAIEALSSHERGTTESERARQIADTLQRCVAHHQGLKASGDPTEDTLRISGEHFETLYFTPFAEADCGCY
jgi:hypothetical protein